MAEASVMNAGMTSGDDFVVELRGVHKTYRLPALLGIDLAVRRGEMLALTGPSGSGQWRPQWAEQAGNPRSPLARADALVPGIADLPGSGPGVEAELRASGHGLNAIVTLQSQRLGDDRTHSRAWANELAAATEWHGWQLSAGKKIVAWNVGYGFRPNDVVAQQARRTLLAFTPEGRPVGMAEHFDARTAWSFVLVNPTASRDQRGAGEPALAMRAYRQDGAVIGTVSPASVRAPRRASAPLPAISPGRPGPSTLRPACAARTSLCG